MGRGGQRWRWSGRTASVNYPCTMTSRATEAGFLKSTCWQDVLQACGLHEVGAGRAGSKVNSNPIQI